MNGLGTAWMWCAVQVTLLGGAGILVYLLARRMGPAVGSLVASTTLLLTSCLTILAFCPLPAWTIRWAVAQQASASVSEREAIVHRSPPAAAESAATFAPPPAATNTLEWLGWFTAALDDELAQIERTETAGPQRNWWGMAGLLCLALATGGLIRILLAFRGVQKVRRRTVAVRDSDVHELIGQLVSELSDRRCEIELRESSELTTAATVGWLRPIILLPIEWREWPAQSLRAVLAHELAHILRRDYLLLLMAQVGVALHAYHPLLHWLAGRMRQDQECAADLTACQVVGGPRAYLTVLATMALEQDNRRLAWSAHPFLPSRRTFLRRLEMLRDLNKKRLPLPPPRVARWAVIAALIVLAVFASGVRSMRSKGELFAQETKPRVVSPATTAPATDNGQQAIRFAYVPRDAAIVIVVRPVALLNHPLAKERADAIGKMQESFSKQLGVPLANVEQISTVMLMNTGAQAGPAPPCMVVRATKDLEQKEVLGKIAPNARSSTYDQYTVHEGANRTCLAFPDERTLLITPEVGLLRRLLVAGSRATPPKAVTATWSQLGNAEAGVFLNTVQLRAELDEDRGNLNDPRMAAMFGALAPLWQKTSSIAGGITLADQVQFRLLAACEKPEDVKAVKETAMAATTLLRNALSQARAAASSRPGPAGPLLLRGIDIGEAVLDEVKISEEGNLVRADATIEGAQLAQFVDTFASGAVAAQGAARRAQSTNNMKQLALAAHNYHDTYGHFPAAVIIGPDGKTPHSWRVALLPFLDQEALYRQYRMDEPWDSPNNQKVLEQMPAVFRDPNEPANSTSSSYYAITGAGTIFEGNEGAKFQTIIDGTSNTLLFVEAKRDIPWTKPEDIDFDADKNPPEVGGHYDEGFLAAIADGSVRFIASTIDPNTLKLLIQKGDGQILPPLP